MGLNSEYMVWRGNIGVLLMRTNVFGLIFVHILH